MNRRNFLGLTIMGCGSVLFTNNLLGNIVNSSYISNSFFESTWIGHSTVLIKFGGTTILTDPVLFDRVGYDILGTTWGLRRYTQPALSPQNLPPIDIVILSHAHIDHMNVESLRFLTERQPNKITCITAFNTKDIIDDLKWGSLIELDWNDSIQVNSVNITGKEVLHNGWRIPGDPCRRAGQLKTGRSYNGYVIERNGLKVAFGGDTAYTKSFKQFGNCDVSIMPIGAYQGCSDNHCTPEESVEMTRMMRSPIILPIHFGTFKQTDEPVWEPIQRLTKYTEGIQIVGNRIGYKFKL